MVIDIRFRDRGPIQIQNVRRVSVYPHGKEPLVIVYSNNDVIPPQYFTVAEIKEYWLTND